MAGVATIAPIGSPDARPLAKVITSGSTSNASAAANDPHRPTPHWISSKIRTAPSRSHASRAARRKSGEQSRAPVRPWTGSMITAATVSSTAAPIAATSLNGTLNESGMPARRAPSSYLAPSVTASVATVRPCHPPDTDTIFCRPVTFRARPSAFSLASAPLLQKNTFLSGSGQFSAISSASCSRPVCGSTVE